MLNKNYVNKKQNKNKIENWMKIRKNPNRRKLKKVKKLNFFWKHNVKNRKTKSDY